MSYIERRMAQLPGMQGLTACSDWAEKIQPILPEEIRCVRPGSIRETVGASEENAAAA
jgi:hypothetical protein